MTTFYVSPTGSDAASGLSEGAAFATLARAQAAMRSSGGRDTAEIAGGVYHLDAPITLTSADSGSSFVAKAGETATVSGGSPVTGWQRGGNGIWTARVDAASVDQLTLDGVRQTESRYPDVDPSDPVRGGWLWAKELPSGDATSSMAFDPADFPAGRAPRPGMSVTVFSENGYATDVLTIESVSGGVMNFTSPANYDLGPGSRYLLSGGAPDRAGEWSFDASTQTLSFLAPSGFDGTGAVASSAMSLFAIDGANDVAIKGLTFSDTSAPDGDMETAAIKASDATGLLVEGNRFVNVGAGIVIEDDSSGNTVAGNTFEHTWSSAISLGAGTSGNTIRGNAVSHSNEVFVQAGAIEMSNSAGNTISHNTITDVPRFAISEINYEPDVPAGGNTIEYNEIVRAGQATPDVGAIYLYSGENPGAQGDVIRFNSISDSGGVATADRAFKPGFEQSSGIYLDDRAGKADIYGNFVEGTTFSGILVHGGPDNAIYDNVVVDSGKFGVSIIAVDGDDPSGNEVYNNIIQVSGDGSNTIDTDQSDAGLIRANVYFSPTGERPSIADLSLSSFQAGGGDRGSIVTADPGFIDRAGGDFGLRAGSVALSLGVDSIPFDQIGAVIAAVGAPPPGSAAPPTAVAPTPPPVAAPEPPPGAPVGEPTPMPPVDSAAPPSRPPSPGRPVPPAEEASGPPPVVVPGPAPVGEPAPAAPVDTAAPPTGPASVPTPPTEQASGPPATPASNMPVDFAASEPEQAPPASEPILFEPSGPNMPTRPDPNLPSMAPAPENGPAAPPPSEAALWGSWPNMPATTEQVATASSFEEVFARAIGNEGSGWQAERFWSDVHDVIDRLGGRGELSAQIEANGLAGQAVVLALSEFRAAAGADQPSQWHW